MAGTQSARIDHNSQSEPEKCYPVQLSSLPTSQAYPESQRTPEELHPEVPQAQAGTAGPTMDAQASHTRPGRQTAPATNTIGTQTRAIPEASQSAQSQRGDKVSLSQPSSNERAVTTKEEQKQWELEKAAMESVQAFLTSQVEPFAEEICRDEQGRFEIGRLIQKVEHFGLKIENGISLATRKDTLVGQICYRICSLLFHSLQTSAKFAKQHIRSTEERSAIKLSHLDSTQQELKAQLQKVKKELYVAHEKMNLAEQMNKLKDKEVQNMKARV